MIVIAILYFKGTPGLVSSSFCTCRCEKKSHAALNNYYIDIFVPVSDI